MNNTIQETAEIISTTETSSWDGIGSMIGYDTTSEKVVDTVEDEEEDEDYQNGQLPISNRPIIQLATLSILGCAVVGTATAMLTGGMDSFTQSKKTEAPQPIAAANTATQIDTNTDKLADAQAKLALQEQQNELSGLKKNPQIPTNSVSQQPIVPITPPPQVKPKTPVAAQPQPRTEVATPIVTPYNQVRPIPVKPQIKVAPIQTAIVPQRAKNPILLTTVKPQIKVAPIQTAIIPQRAKNPILPATVNPPVALLSNKNPDLPTPSSLDLKQPDPIEPNTVFGGRFTEVAIASSSMADSSLLKQNDKTADKNNLTEQVLPPNLQAQTPEDGVLNGYPVNPTNYLQIGMVAKAQLVTAMETSTTVSNNQSAKANTFSVAITQPFKAGLNDVLPAGTIIDFVYTVADNGLVTAVNGNAYFGNKQIPLEPGVLKLASDRGQALVANYRELGADRIASITNNQAIFGALQKAGEILTSPDQVVTSSNSGIGGSSFSSSTSNNRNILGAVAQGAGNEYLNDQRQQSTAERTRLNSQSRLWTIDRGANVSIIVQRPLAVTLPL
jgi:hypothetical protein